MTNDDSESATYRCENCGSPMEKGRAAPLDRGHRQVYHCTSCENSGSVTAQPGIGVRVRGMVDAQSHAAGGSD